MIPQKTGLPLPWLNHATKEHPHAEYAMLDKREAYKKELIGISKDKPDLEWVRLSHDQLERNIRVAIVDRIKIRPPPTAKR